MEPKVISARCCVAGGGPAGMMAGYLLARMGVDVVVLEKHADFLRDFRGDTVHPSTLELMYELGILDAFLKLPHQEIRELSGQVENEMVPIGDFTRLPTHCKFVALMPQWDFLAFIKEQASGYPGFHVIMEAEVTDLVEENGKIVGARAKTKEGPLEIRAALTIGADGRHSTVRERAGLKVIDIGAPMDVLWMRISRQPSDPGQTFGHVVSGKVLVMLNRDDYWQCAFVIPKGKGEEIRQQGLDSFRQQIAAIEPLLRDRVSELRDWKQVSLLTVTVDRLEKWSRPGLLCIGDAAHAMSPIGGVGINLAIQDAVATANILGERLLRQDSFGDELQEVQRRREFPTRATQGVQVFVQNRVIKQVLGTSQPIKVGWPLKIVRSLPVLRRTAARMLGVGFRPEHIRTPDIHRLK
jgi:2-polyprenyl-6-methoxyphenol hydroxylase-like FAD-dependent oxidoreductase